MNQGRRDSSDQVGGDLSEGEMEGARVPQWDCCYRVVLAGVCFWRVVVRGMIPLLGGGLVELFLA